MIALDGVAIGVPGRTLVRGIHARIAAGEFLAVLGPNGVGKTTLLRAMCGIRPVLEGTIAVDGRALRSLSVAARARAIAFVTADDAMIESLRVRDVVAIGRYPHHPWWEWNPNPQDHEAVERALRAVQMTREAERLFTTLSSGERQRIWIAMGLAQATPVILLDEPTSHLDVRVAHEILALLRDLARDGRTVVCVLHDLNDAAAYADRLLLLGCERMLACDVPDRVLVPQLIEEAYGVGVLRVDTPQGPRVFTAVRGE
ncbi:MAG TPA: ABC transporter ATP-binding protein [Candidatus Baltobacteraceae bacterium]|nr:ABC transporter ATP-binding protein [Candidatus Baltobacteraceae bacterium]